MLVGGNALSPKQAMENLLRKSNKIVNFIVFSKKKLCKNNKKIKKF